MITLKKLATLPESTRLRKIHRLCRELRFESHNDVSYIQGLAELSKDVCAEAATKIIKIISYGGSIGPRELEHLRTEIQDYLGESEADWDFTKDSPLGEISKNVLPLSVFVEDLRSPFNLGSIIRTAEAMGFSSVIRNPHSTSFEHKRTVRSSMGAEQFIQCREYDLKDLEELSLPIFALELGGEDISDFSFPDKGIVILGSEELGVSPDALRICDASYGRVSIPMYGKKGSMNVGVAFGILAHYWASSLLKYNR